MYVYRVDCGGCNGCEIEIFGSITPVFDVERFGIKVVPSPRHADVLLYTGAVTRAMRMPALRAFEAAPDPKIVVSYGACGCTGGIFYDNYCVWGGTDKILPVDVYIPGCPPSPAQTIYGFAMALGLLDQKLHAETTVEAAGEQADILHPGVPYKLRVAIEREARAMSGYRYGRDLANELGVNLCGLLLGGEGIESAAKELGGYGADKVIVCESPLLATYTTDGYAKVICDVIEDLKPEAFLIGATNIGRDLGPRCAARLHTGLCADCTHLDVDVPNYIQFLRESSTLDVDSMKWDMEDRNLKMTRPAFGGHLMATIICPRFRPCMATVRPGVMKKNAFDEAKANAVEIVKPNFTLTAEDIHTDVTEVVKAAKKLVDLIGADFIVSVGRGISKDVEGGIKLAEELAEVLGGVVGGSRATIDSGWLSADHQVGQTGKTVHPKVYVALGISGAIQHKAGMQDSECIIAVNKNDTAPIFEIADYGICGDLFKVTPMLIEAIKAAKAAK